MGICPNAYYNYLKHRKADYCTKKEEILGTIKTIYHEHSGVDGYRSMQVFLKRKGYQLSRTTVHKYMNRELKLFSVVRRKRPGYTHGKPHKVFENLIKQDFSSDAANRKWCTDFTFLYLADGNVRYNCSIIDLHDRSVVASVTGRNMTSALAIRTVDKALASQPGNIRNLILHSDQGTQYTSKEFTEYCKLRGITQSMSKAGYPYDNAPMERYFNTLKNEKTNLHIYHTEEELFKDVNDFAYVWYNHIRPHSADGYMTPFEARYRIRNY